MASPIVSGVARTSVQAIGASPATSARPIAAQANRHPWASTTAPTMGNAIMKPMLIARA